MAEIICPLCEKPNSADADECVYCGAPLKTGGFLASPEEAGSSENLPAIPNQPAQAEKEPSSKDSISGLESSIPDWLRETEAGFLSPSEPEIDKSTSEEISEQIDSLVNPEPSPSPTSESENNEEWLMSLLSQTGGDEAGSEKYEEGSALEQPGAAEEAIGEAPVEDKIPEKPIQPVEQAEKPKWLQDLEAASPIKLGGENLVIEAEEETAGGNVEPVEEVKQDQTTIPDWVSTPDVRQIPPAPPSQPEPEIASAELPGWLEALRPPEIIAPSGPVEDLSGADVVTVGPLSGLRGVISTHPSAIRAQKPPTYSIKLRVTDEQRARMEMMETLLVDEQKPKPLPTQPIITSRNVFRLVIAIALLLPIIWMIIIGSQRASTPQPGDIPGVTDFTQGIQTLPSGALVLVAFDYEAGFSGEMNIAITNAVTQLMNKSAFLTLVTTTPSGPALAESTIKQVSKDALGDVGTYSKYTDLGYIPGGTIGLLGLAKSPRTILPYSMDGDNVWADAPLNAISSISDFSLVIVMTNDADIARSWIEQVGPFLQTAGKPLLIVTSAQAEPIIRPYYETVPPQVYGIVAGIAGGFAYGRTLGNIQPSGVWDALSISVAVSVLIILVGSIAGVITQMMATDTNKES